MVALMLRRLLAGFVVIALVLPAAAAPPRSLFELSAITIEGRPQELSRYRGQVVLVVNVASRCMHTSQYAGLERLWRANQNKGFVILGFPSNDFANEEPGSEAEIKQFCSLRYDVTFPLFAKIKVKGPEQSPVYRFLAAKQGEPRWNFHKYLVGRDGQVIRAFAGRVSPEDQELRAAIATALGR
jgi:glutathione peroxidase